MTTKWTGISPYVSSGRDERKKDPARELSIKSDMISRVIFLKLSFPLVSRLTNNGNRFLTGLAPLVALV
jgi:hypothetical protein